MVIAHRPTIFKLERARVIFRSKIPQNSPIIISYSAILPLLIRIDFSFHM